MRPLIVTYAWLLTRLPELNFIDDKAGKPVGIQQHIGRRPIFAAELQLAARPPAP